MSALNQFGDFVKTTGVKIITSPDKIINDATKNTYLIAKMLKGKEPAQSCQAGSRIKDSVQLSDAGTATFYRPNEDLDIQNVQTLKDVYTDWRFLADHFTYTEEEITLNGGDSQTHYKNLLKGKRQACKTSTFNKMEGQLFATPDTAEMESQEGEQPYSIPTFVTVDGLAPSGFTNVQGLNPTSIGEGYQNQTETYDPDNKTDPDDGLLNAMDRMFHKVQFIAPATLQDYAESDRLQKMIIVTNLDGITLYQRLTRNANDALQPANNLGWMAGGVTYAGIPVHYNSGLNTALVAAGGTTAIPSGQPWFYYLNLEYLYPIFHTTKYMTERDPMTPERQPFSRVVWSNTYYNLRCQSRRRQGLVSAA